MLESRTREKQKKQMEKFKSRDVKRREHQEDLYNQRLNDLKKRYLVDKVKLGSELGHQSFKLNSVTAYKSYELMLASSRPNTMHYDGKANSIIVPILHAGSN